jgi:hypothetical protein
MRMRKVHLTNSVDDPDKAADDHKDDPSPAEAKVEEKKQQTKEPVRLVEPPVWKTYDFLYPGGRVAKLVNRSE